MHLLVSYDIKLPKRLRKVHRTMLAYGRPLQYSVFECALKPAQLEALRHELAALIDHEEDSVLILSFGPTCITLGCRPPLLAQPHLFLD
ncbi:CRISPR-associated endonuclease Cas2 [Microbulbifer flavimaris]|uniref:CRISPR-associated endoribonuclease Cas2 n=1 Tax=Microbulbifer flavimaris TaxID=1781068 RepID=A0ABX4I100_9GAMM|nr:MULTISPECIES: CRISPR-associated endonuclease Cas2 [Microbulbifer]KUJ83434.1 hypothetical protein AVO43_06105 [Microbulbifer sp. ZGT114]PCO05590.1 CRISPR-associated endonuclease Cas2 [Microbulbifer flavimaris]